MHTFPIAPATGRAYWLAATVMLVVIVPIVLFVIAVLGAKTARFDVSPAGLRVRGDLFGRLVPAAALRSADARRVNFTEKPSFTPSIRTMGTGLPGYRAGWFRLRNGEKALVFLTDTTHAVYIPTTLGYSVIVSPADPDAFLAALRGAKP